MGTADDYADDNVAGDGDTGYVAGDFSAAEFVVVLVGVPVVGVGIVVVPVVVVVAAVAADSEKENTRMLGDVVRRLLGHENYRAIAFVDKDVCVGC